MSPEAIDFLLVGVDDQKKRELIITAATTLSEGVAGSYPEAISVLLTACARSVHRSIEVLDVRTTDMQKTMASAQSKMIAPREELQRTRQMVSDVQTMMNVALDLQKKAQITLTQLSARGEAIAVAWSKGSTKIDLSLQKSNQSYLALMDKGIESLPDRFTPHLEEGFRKAFESLETQVEQVGHKLWRKCQPLHDAAEQFISVSKKYDESRYRGLARLNFFCSGAALIIGLVVGTILEKRNIPGQQPDAGSLGIIEHRLLQSGATYEISSLQDGSPCLVIHLGQNMRGWFNNTDCLLQFPN